MQTLVASQLSASASAAAVPSSHLRQLGHFRAPQRLCWLPERSSEGVLSSKLISGVGATSAVPPRPSTSGRPHSRLVTRAQSDPQPSEPEQGKTPFGYTRKDVLLIGLALTGTGYGIRYGLEYIFGVEPLQAGNITQLVVVIGLCLGWISTYLWRVGNKEMTYAKQLRDYESAVMQKRLEAMSETDLEAMLAEVEEEKQRLREKRAKAAAKKE